LRKVPKNRANVTPIARGRGGRGPRGRKRFAEFFCGIGLVHEALKDLGWTCVYANDIDPKKTEAYSRNFADVEPHLADLRDVDPETLPAFELATASFPCVDVSQAGGREGIHGEGSGLVWVFLDKLRALRDLGRLPRFLLIENVPGLLTHDDGRGIEHLLRGVASLGYAFDVVQVDAKHFTPQSRNRVFVIGTTDDVASSQVLMPDEHIRRYKVQHAYERTRDLAWAFFDFPDLPERKVGLDKVLVDLPDDDSRWWNEERTAYFWEHLEHDHKPRLRAMVEAGLEIQMTAVRRGRRRRLREQIFNLRFDGLASCLRTPKGGSAIQFIVRVRRGKAKIRRILGIESARLQGVCLTGMSPNFIIPDKEQEALFAFGDAVCVPALRWVVQHSIDAMADGKDVLYTGHLPLADAN
jgi:DNA (cytosine-5)-methyltransferase 1